MAPQAILELVDGKRDMLFSMTARNVARSAILGTKWLSIQTKHAMHRLFQFRGENAVKEFDEEVERQKGLLLREDKVYEAWRKRREEKPLGAIEDRIEERVLYMTSRHNLRGMHEINEKMKEKRRKESYVSDEEKQAELDALKGTSEDDEGHVQSLPTVNERKPASSQAEKKKEENTA